MGANSESKEITLDIGHKWDGIFYSLLKIVGVRAQTEFIWHRIRPSDVLGSWGSTRDRKFVHQDERLAVSVTCSYSDADISFRINSRHKNVNYTKCNV
jgi:hypothetical protein